MKNEFVTPGAFENLEVKQGRSWYVGDSDGKQSVPCKEWDVKLHHIKIDSEKYSFECDVIQNLPFVYVHNPSIIFSVNGTYNLVTNKPEIIISTLNEESKSYFISRMELDLRWKIEGDIFKQPQISQAPQTFQPFQSENNVVTNLLDAIKEAEQFEPPTSI